MPAINKNFSNDFAYIKLFPMLYTASIEIIVENIVIVGAQR